MPYQQTTIKTFLHLPGRAGSRTAARWRLYPSEGESSVERISDPVNQRFGVSAAQPESAYRPADQELDLDSI